MPAPTHHILFSDHFQIDKSTLEDYGAFDISLLSDLPLFIDPFLLFHSEKNEYQELHASIIRYLTFLRDKSVRKEVTKGLLEDWYHFKEVKHTWLGFSQSGNRGSGLGKEFAEALNTNFYRLFGEGQTHITKGKHLEKLCLIKEGVGRDNISDFTTNLIKEFLLEYTQTFAKTYLKPDQYRFFPVQKVKFNYQTECWETRKFELPHKNDDYILLVPQDLLARDDTFINRTDLIRSFDHLPEAISDASLRGLVSNYFEKVLPEDADDRERKEAIHKTILQYPELIDYYIRFKEDKGDQAVAESRRKVYYAQSLFLENFRSLTALVADESDFYDYSVTTLEEALARVQCLKEIIEDRGGSQYLYNTNGNPIPNEEELRIAYQFLWRFQPGGSDPVDSKTILPVEFKLASNRTLKTFLNKKTDAISKAHENDPDKAKPGVTVIFHFNEFDDERVAGYLTGLESNNHQIITINASRTSQQRKGMTMDGAEHKFAFISYTHDCDVWDKKGQDPLTHKKRVSTLEKKLHSEGVLCIFDQQIDSPPETWPRWMMNKIEDAGYVLVVCTETYNRRFRGKEEPDRGKGGQWEGGVITQILYDDNGKNEKFIPVIFEKSDEQFIPLPLRGATYYDVSTDEGYNALYYRLTNQPGYTHKPLGPIRKRREED